QASNFRGSILKPVNAAVGIHRDAGLNAIDDCLRHPSQENWIAGLCLENPYPCVPGRPVVDIEEPPLACSLSPLAIDALNSQASNRPRGDCATGIGSLARKSRRRRRIVSRTLCNSST